MMMMMMMMIAVYCHFCAPGRLNGPSDLRRQRSEVEDETPFRYAHAEIRTWVVAICGPTRYQLDWFRQWSLDTDVGLYASTIITVAPYNAEEWSQYTRGPS